MLNNLTGWHFLIILVIVLLLFGAPKLPALARSLGQSMKIFKNEIKSDKDDADTAGNADDSSKAAGTADPTTKP
ncbi:MAG TPA: twin-arginine translocase TatA/TatE family subunit [Cryobacterium sp.]|nr:twin-arginine translocase TatA/TatE family subunit [Cryobacterium sp.]